MEIAIGFGGVIIGFVLAFGGTALRDWWTARKNKRSLAAVLLVEIVSQAQWVSGRGSLWNAYAESGKSVELGVARRDRPPRALVYESVAGKIATLPAELASRVIAFHGAVATVRDWVDSRASEGDSTDLRGSALKDIQAKWKASCFNAILAIRGLQPIALIPSKPNDEQEITTLLDHLQIVADGGLIAAG